VNARNREGNTPLHNAAQQGSYEVVELLVSAKAEINAKNKGQWTPLMEANGLRQRDVVELLLRSGARQPGIFG
jgi:ankyrin repeat protein